MKIRVLLAEGRKIFCEGLSLLLERHSDLKVVGEADEPGRALKLVEALAPHVIVFDLSLTSCGALEFIRAARKASPQSRILALTLSPTSTFIQDLLQAGAAGCLTRECAGADLVGAIRTVMTHKVYLSPTLTEAVVSGYALPSRSGKQSQRLSARERHVLQRIADGETTKQIAAALKVSTKTVETHRRRIMEKLKKHSVAELTKYALREGLTSIDFHH